MPVRNQSDAPAPRRPCPDPAWAILAFVGSTFCCTFSQLSLFLRWSWYGEIACDATGPLARAKLGKARTLLRKTTDRLVDAGLISKKELYLDRKVSRSACIFVGTPGSSLPDNLHDVLCATWDGHGGKVKVEIFALPDRAHAVLECGITRTEPRIGEICLGDGLLKDPQTIGLSPELEAVWLDFKRSNERTVKGPTDASDESRPRSSVPETGSWALESRWVAWPHLVAETGTTDTSTEHAKRRLAVGRSRVGDRGRVVVVPIVAYWHKGMPELMNADRGSLMATLDEMLAECGRRGQTLEVWAPAPIVKEGHG